MGYAYKISGGKHGGRKPLGTPRCGWEYNTKFDNIILN
jgi:hypothetical protein